MNKNLITSQLLGFPISQSVDETACLMKYARQVKATDVIIDVGTRNGGSALVMAVASGGRVVTIDIKEDPREPGYGYGPILPLEEHWRYHGGENIEQVTCNSWEYEENGDPVGMVFLDGSHEYHDVVKDFYHFFPMVEHGGWVLIHDYGLFPDVTKFVDEIESVFSIIDRVESIVVIERD